MPSQDQGKTEWWHPARVYLRQTSQWIPYKPAVLALEKKVQCFRPSKKQLFNHKLMFESIKRCSIWLHSFCLQFCLQTACRKWAIACLTEDNMTKWNQSSSELSSQINSVTDFEVEKPWRWPYYPSTASRFCSKQQKKPLLRDKQENRAKSRWNKEIRDAVSTTPLKHEIILQYDWFSPVRKTACRSKLGNSRHFPNIWCSGKAQNRV